MSTNRPSSSDSRPLTGSRPSQGRRPPSTSTSPREEDVEKLEEGVAHANGHISNGFDGEYNDDKTSAGKRLLGGSKDGGDWEDLAAKAQSVGRQWQRAWQKDGFAG